VRDCALKDFFVIILSKSKVAFRRSLLTIGDIVLCYLKASGSLLRFLLSSLYSGTEDREGSFLTSILWCSY